MKQECASAPQECTGLKSLASNATILDILIMIPRSALAAQSTKSIILTLKNA